jgi:ribosome biogenesis protein UTP30
LLIPRRTLPHPLLASPSSSICLITADPQRTYKDLLSAPGFPTELASRIRRVIGLSKLKAKYKSYEARRQLRAEYDIFLADERIITSLPSILGKSFYKATSKRPIPVSLTGNDRFEKDDKGRKIKPKNAETKEGRLVGTPATVAKEIERTLNMALVSLSPSVTTAIQVGRADFEPKQIVENVTQVVEELLKRIVPQGWRNLRSLHIKGPETMAIPVWLASELWVDSNDVLEEGQGEAAADKTNKKRKRKNGES